MQKMKLAYSFDDVLLVPRYSKIKSRKDVDLSTQITPRYKIDSPLISANMSDVTGVEMAISIGKLGGIGVIPRFMATQNQAEIVTRVKKEGLTCAAAVGVREDPKERAEILVNAGVNILFIDVAHGHMEKVIKTTKILKSLYGNRVDIVSGNVATYEACKALFSHGADSVKVGIGPGSICTTRIVTGFGIPQISAILDCAKLTKKGKKYLIADGGIKNSGDIVKALAAGASAVMIGKLFAASQEAPGKIIEENGVKYKQYNGSTSKEEKIKQLKAVGKKLSSNYTSQIEGVESKILYKGKLSKIIDELEAGLRSGFSYAGAKNIKELWKNSQFVQITQNGVRESNAHDVILT